MHEINTTENKYVNSEDSLVEVFFSLPGRDWYELSRSRCWKAVESFLRQKKGGETNDRMLNSMDRSNSGNWSHEKNRTT